MSDAIYERVVSEILPTAYVCHLGGGNYGEVTIAKQFPQFLKDCGRHQVKIGLTTNGRQVRDAWLPDLIRNSVSISISMEGIHDQFEVIRGYKWDKFLDNVKRMVRTREDLGARCRLEWHYCAHVDSIHQLPEMIRIADDVGVDHIRLMNLVPYIEDQKYKQLAYHRTHANKWLGEARKVIDELGYDARIPRDFRTGSWESEEVGDPPKGIIDRLRRDGGAPEEITIDVCSLPWQACTVDELGNVRPCCVYSRYMGNMDAKTSFESVWNSPKYMYLRSTINRASNQRCYSCRISNFDSDDSLAESQLKPSLRQLVESKIQNLGRRRVKYCDDEMLKMDFSLGFTPGDEDLGADVPNSEDGPSKKGRRWASG